MSRVRHRRLAQDLYVYVVDSSGHVRAHGTNPKLIDKDLTQLKDADGKTFIVDIVEMVKAKKIRLGRLQVDQSREQAD